MSVRKFAPPCQPLTCRQGGIFEKRQPQGHFMLPQFLWALSLSLKLEGSSGCWAGGRPTAAGPPGPVASRTHPAARLMRSQDLPRWVSFTFGTVMYPCSVVQVIRSLLYSFVSTSTLQFLLPDFCDFPRFSQLALSLALWIFRGNCPFTCAFQVSVSSCIPPIPVATFWHWTCFPG